VLDLGDGGFSIRAAESFGAGWSPFLRDSTLVSICGDDAPEEVGYTAGTGRRVIVSEFAVLLTSNGDEAAGVDAGRLVGAAEPTWVSPAAGGRACG
jgi:hypothetical protein